jgi:hypothetical protein
MSSRDWNKRKDVLKQVFVQRMREALVQRGKLPGREETSDIFEEE